MKLQFNVDARAPSIPLLNFPLNSMQKEWSNLGSEKVEGLQAKMTPNTFLHHRYSVTYPGAAWRISSEELTQRRDLRGECIFTIDPTTARDLDDALHCKALGDGQLMDSTFPLDNVFCFST